MQTQSVRPNVIRASSSQSTPPRQTALPTPLPSLHEETHVTPDLMASLPNHTSPLLSQPHPAYPDNIHSQSVTTTGQAMWREGVRHTSHQERDFSVNGEKIIAPAAEQQVLQETPMRAPQPLEEDFGWLTSALHEKVRRLKRYPYQAR